MRTRASLRDLVLPASLFVLAVAVRLLPWAHVFPDGRVSFYDADVWMRFRRILVYLEAFPATAVHDFFQGFPRGTGVISPPTMEYVVAALARPFRAAPGLVPALERIVALVPPLVGGATVLALRRFVLRWFGPFEAACATLLLALMPAHVDATVLGRFDNEMMEPLLLLLAVAAYARTYETPSPRIAWSLTGLASTAYLLVWRGALFPLALFGLDATVRLARRVGTAQARPLATSIAAMYAVPAAAMLVICGADVWGTRATFQFNVPSLFHLALFGGASAAFLLAGRVVPPDERLTPGRAALAGAWIAACVVGGLLLWRQLGRGIEVVGGGDAWIDSIVQYERGSLSDVPLLFGLVGVLAPALAALLLLPRFRTLPPRTFLLLWSVAMLAAAILRLRFAIYAAVAVALLGGIAAGVAAAYLRRVPRAAVAGSLLLLQAPTVPDLATFYGYGATFSIRGDVEDTLFWLRDHTPPAGDPRRPTTPPAYGVLAPWDWGGWIEAIAGRPSVATSFGREAYGMEELSRFLLAADDGAARQVLDANRVRYVVLASPFRSLSTHAALSDARIEYVRESLDPRSGQPVYAPTAAAFGLVSIRLFFADGALARAGPLTFAPVEGLRLVHESGSSEPVGGLPWDVKRVKVFERVAGARLSVRAAPGAAVALSQRVETNRGRTFEYRIEKTCGAGGTAEFVLAYAPRTGPDATGAVGPARIASGAVAAEVAPTAADVDAGRRIEVDLRAPSAR